ncbi:hypothetical protein JCM10207_005426 [Rhodosporidiobolus poonsookiae]
MSYEGGLGEARQPHPTRRHGTVHGVDGSAQGVGRVGQADRWTGGGRDKPLASSSSGHVAAWPQESHAVHRQLSAYQQIDYDAYPPTTPHFSPHPPTTRSHPGYPPHAAVFAPYSDPPSVDLHPPYPYEPLARPSHEHVAQAVRPPTPAGFAPQIGVPAAGYRYPPAPAHGLPSYAQTAHPPESYAYQPVYPQQPSQQLLPSSPHLGFPLDAPSAPLQGGHESYHDLDPSAYDVNTARLHHPTLAYSPFRHRQRSTTLASNPPRSAGRAASRPATADATRGVSMSAPHASQPHPAAGALQASFGYTAQHWPQGPHLVDGEGVGALWYGQQQELQGSDPMRRGSAAHASEPLPGSAFARAPAPSFYPPQSASAHFASYDPTSSPYGADISSTSVAPPPTFAATPFTFASPSGHPAAHSPHSFPALASAPASDSDDLSIVSEAARRRQAHAAQPPPLAYRPARGSTPLPSSLPTRSRSRVSSAGTSLSSTPASMASLPLSQLIEADRLLARRLREERQAEIAQLENGRANRNTAGSIVSLELLVRCTCGACPISSGAGMLLARIVLRGLKPEMVEFLEGRAGQAQPELAVEIREPRGWRCLQQIVRQQAELKASVGTAMHAEAQPLAELSSSSSEGGNEPGAGAGTYSDTLSAAVDRLQRLDLDEDGASRRTATMPAQTAISGLPGSPLLTRSDIGDGEGEREDWQKLKLVQEKKVAEEWKKRTLKCDVCSRSCGIASLSPSAEVIAARSPTAPPKPPPFTVEVICARCDALFKCCSDCGGGGGRLTPGRWRCRELFPDGRKTCKLSHARNPALGEVTCEVLPLLPAVPSDIAELAARCRSIYFNARLGMIARPDFLLKGDGLASTFAQAERVSIDHWALLEKLLLDEQPDEQSGIRHYLSLLFSKPRRRHPKRSTKPEDTDGWASGKGRGATADAEQVPFGFGIVEADFNIGSLYFCAVLPWYNNGQAFDAITFLGESTTARVKADISAANLRRLKADLPLYPPLKYNYVSSPFKSKSRGNVGLVRRGYEPLVDLVKRDPSFPLSWFPPIKDGWLPSKYAAALSTWVRVLDGDEDLGGPPPENAPRKRSKKVVGPVNQLRGSQAEPSSSSSQAPSQGYSLPHLHHPQFPHPSFASSSASSHTPSSQHFSPYQGGAGPYF